MRQVDTISLAKAILWEEAKGKLRAIVAAEGSAQSTPPGSEYPFESIERAVEKFIKSFEDDGFHE